MKAVGIVMMISLCTITKGWHDKMGTKKLAIVTRVFGRQKMMQDGVASSENHIAIACSSYSCVNLSCSIKSI